MWGFPLRCEFPRDMQNKESVPTCTDNSTKTTIIAHAPCQRLHQWNTTNTLMTISPTILTKDTTIDLPGMMTGVLFFIDMIFFYCEITTWVEREGLGTWRAVILPFDAKTIISAIFHLIGWFVDFDESQEFTFSAAVLVIERLLSSCRKMLLFAAPTCDEFLFGTPCE